MGKLFLKLWVLILLTSVSSYYIQRQVFESAARENAASGNQDRVRRTFVLIEEALSATPVEDWPARAALIEQRLGTPARVVPLGQLKKDADIDDAARTRIGQRGVHIRTLPNDGGVVMYRLLRDTDQVAVLTAPAPVQPLIFGIFRPIVFTWMVESSMYALALLLWLRLFWRDMKKVDAAAEQVGAGNFDLQLHISKGAALRPIADSFNRMAERIGKLVNSQRDLTNAVSHELKTPLSRLRFALSLAEDAGAAEREQLIRKMHQDVDELDSLVQEMLLYSRLERNAATPAIDMQPVPVESWLPHAVEDEIEAAQAADISIPVAVEASVADAACEPKYMARAVQNLVRNALRYAKTRVEVRVEASRNRYQIHVDDDGPGIPVADQARLFVPFARLDGSRTRHDNAGGTGLGLAIVQRIAEWHGGRALISTSAMGGARITIDWPAAKAA